MVTFTVEILQIKNHPKKYNDIAISLVLHCVKKKMIFYSLFMISNILIVVKKVKNEDC